jgi:hypothetical protein
METTETTENSAQPSGEPGLILTLEAQSYLREAGKWANFLGIVGFVLCGFIAIIALFAGAMMSMISKFSPDPMAGGMLAGMSGLITVIYLLVALVYFFFSLYLYQFGSQIKKGLMFTDNDHVTIALGKLKSFFKLWGILTIVVLCLYALVIVVAIIFGAAASSMLNK